MFKCCTCGVQMACAVQWSNFFVRFFAIHQKSGNGSVMQWINWTSPLYDIWGSESQSHSIGRVSGDRLDHDPRARLYSVAAYSVLYRVRYCVQKELAYQALQPGAISIRTRWLPSGNRPLHGPAQVLMSGWSTTLVRCSMDIDKHFILQLYIVITQVSIPFHVK